GLPMLLDETLPRLIARLGEGGVELHFIGRVDLDETTKARLRHPSVRLRGFVEDLTAEIQKAHLFLVPIRPKAGARTRLLTAAAHGGCIAAHEAARLGSPELKHGENVLLAPDGAGLAREILLAWGDTALRNRLGASARRAYMEHFSPETAGRRW